MLFILFGCTDFSRNRVINKYREYTATMCTSLSKFKRQLKVGVGHRIGIITEVPLLCTTWHRFTLRMR